MIRPVQTKGPTICKKIGCGKIYVTDCSEGEYKEVFFRPPGKAGGCPAAMLQALAKVASLALRAGVTKDELIRIWKNIGCPHPIWDGPVQMLSCPDAIAKALEKK